MNINEIQSSMQAARLDGWLFYDFEQRDHSAYRILNLDKTKIFKRRWYYFIPAVGEPVKLCHRMEQYNLDNLPGKKLIYLSWQQLRNNIIIMLQSVLKINYSNGKAPMIAMQYSANNMNPYVSSVDAGTVEYIRSIGIEVVSSGELICYFQSHLSDVELDSHITAYKLITSAARDMFRELADRIMRGENPTEFDMQIYASNFLKANNLTWDMGPIISINEHNANPHFLPTPDNSLTIKKDDLAMIDVWAKLAQPGSIYADITWMGYVGQSVPSHHQNLFQLTCNARNNAFNLIKERFASKIQVYGWEADDAARRIITQAGFGDNFIHRTGHNICEDVHGPGTHIDNLEMKEERGIIPGSCFSIEPGIYLPEQKAGYRTEIDVYITNDGKAMVADEMQDSIQPII